MQKRILLLAAMVLQASAQTPASSVIRKAADALGGADRIKSLHSIRLEGYGQEAVQNGGGNTSASREAPQRWTNALNWEETIDLANQRIRIRQRAQAWLPAATMSRVIGNITTTAILDGDVAYNVNQQGVRPPHRRPQSAHRNANPSRSVSAPGPRSLHHRHNPRTEGKSPASRHHSETRPALHPSHRREDRTPPMGPLDRKRRDPPRPHSVKNGSPASNPSTA